MNLLSNIFYILPLLFICVEVYQLINRDKVFTKFDPNLALYSPIPNLFFYLFKILYLIWLPIGLFSHLWIFFFGIMFLGLFKYVILSTKKNIAINLYDGVNTIISVFLLIIIFLQGLFQ
jgi:hypothetical protein